MNEEVFSFVLEMSNAMIDQFIYMHMKIQIYSHLLNCKSIFRLPKDEQRKFTRNSREFDYLFNYLI